MAFAGLFWTERSGQCGAQAETAKIWLLLLVLAGQIRESRREAFPIQIRLRNWARLWILHDGASPLRRAKGNRFACFPRLRKAEAAASGVAKGGVGVWGSSLENQWVVLARVERLLFPSLPTWAKCRVGRQSKGEGIGRRLEAAMVDGRMWPDARLFIQCMFRPCGFFFPGSVSRTNCTLGILGLNAKTHAV